MHRIDTPDSVANMFSMGNPATGQQGTVIGADWPNAVQEELVALIVGCGGTLNKADNTQLREALLTQFPAMPHAWLAAQTLNGAAGDTSAALVTDVAVAGARKLVWQMSGGNDRFMRFYLTGGNTLEITYNAAWNGTTWYPDVSGTSRCFSVGTNGFRIFTRSGSTGFSDADWSASPATATAANDLIDKHNLDAAAATLTARTVAARILFTAGGPSVQAGPVSAAWQGGSSPYTVCRTTFTTPFAAVPSITVTPEIGISTNPMCPQIYGAPTTSYFDLKVWSLPAAAYAQLDASSGIAVHINATAS